MINSNLNNSSFGLNNSSNRVDNKHLLGGGFFVNGINTGKGGSLNTNSHIITRNDNNNLKQVLSVYNKNENDRPNNHSLLGTREGGNFLDTLGKAVGVVAPFLPLIL
jgi:hypothetical protein